MGHRDLYLRQGERRQEHHPPVGEPIRFDYYEHTYAAVKFPNGVTDAQHYDTDGRIQRINQYFYDQPADQYRQLTDQELDYGGTDSLQSITDEDYNKSLTYTYDDQGRMRWLVGTSPEKSCSMW